MTSESTPITGETYGEEQARGPTREFLLAEAKKPTQEILASVEAALTRFEESLRGVSEPQAAFAPEGEGEAAFSIAQTARHVSSSAQLMASRLVSISRGEEPTRGTGPGRFEDVPEGTVRELIAALEPAREALRQGEAAIRDSSDGTVAHPAWGELSCAGYLRMIGLHIEDHVHQVAKIKAEPGYPIA